jgi:hypothetical protein
METSMSDTSSHDGTEQPHYKVNQFATPETAEKWLSDMAKHSYRFVSMQTVSATNHFSKEMESLVWMVVELEPSFPENRPREIP